MKSSVRTLPIRMTIGEGESFASYMNRLASDTHAPLAALMKATGIVDDESSAYLSAGYGLMLSRTRLAMFSHATGLPETEVSAMLLTTYDGIVCDFSTLDGENPKSFFHTASRQWAYFRGSHVCPECLKESGGVWKLAWKLPWSFTCMRHKRLLVDTCPSCEKRMGGGRQDGRSAPSFPSLVPDPLACRNTLPVGQTSRGSSSRPCGHSLSGTPAKSLKGHKRLLETQERIDRAMMEDDYAIAVAGVPVTSLEYFSDLRSLFALLLSYGTVGDVGDLPHVTREAFKNYIDERKRARSERTKRRIAGAGWRTGPWMKPYARVPENAALVAAVAPAAVEILASDSTAEMADKLGPFVDRIRREARPAARQRLKAFGLSSRLQAGFEPSLAPYMKTVHRLSAQATKFPELSTDHVPQLFWKAEFDSMFHDSRPGAKENHARRFCSMWLVKLIENCTWTEAAERLDLPANTGPGMSNKAIMELNKEGNSDHFVEMLCAVARRLAEDPDRIDYGSRRRSLSDFTEIDDADWRDICAEAGVHRGMSGGKIRYATAWVWCELTEGDFTLAPALQHRNPEFRSTVYRKFLKRDLGKLEPCLLKYSDELLAERALI